MKKIVIIGAVVAIVIAAFALGFADKDSALGRLRYLFFRARGAVATVGPPAGPKGPGTPQNATLCRQNLDRIQNGKRLAAETRGNNIGNVTWEEVIAALHPNDTRVKGNSAHVNELIPKCPNGGHYTLDSMQSLVKCSIGGQNTVTTEDDHVITR